ncbi:uncharacterized protein LOC132745572 [Ruditapes philippinarum]|uniref:uncharacterized protein LOC132745572 n=1 Tax=Ruditapes philippinarum TaxID=129788 RepID=UPI00295AADBB|nr:uncharacterized protein LOC132745572 [Ruditapes philippinarum]
MQDQDLNSLQLDQIYKAFDIAQETFDAPGKILVLVTKEFYRKAIEFTRDNFLTKEPINRSLNVQYTSEYEGYWITTMKQNLSLMIIAKETEDVVAIIRIKVQCKDDRSALTGIPAKPTQQKHLITSYCSSKADFFGYYGTTQALHFVGLTVSQKYQKQGMASKIVNSALCMIRNLEIKPIYVKTESASIYAQKIFEKAGFEILFEQPFDKWTVDGKQLIDNTGVHESRKNYGLKV